MNSSQPIARIGIGVFVFKDSKFLMGCRRGAHGAETWSVPGGHLEFGETWEQTAAREIEEETGIKIRNIRFGAVTNDIFQDENKHYVTIWMLSEWDSGEATMVEPDKFVDLGWYHFDALPEPLFLPWQQLFESPFFVTIKEQFK